MIDTSGSPSIQWFLNPYHNFRTRRLRSIRVFALALFCLTAGCFLALGVLGSRASSGEQGGLVAVAFLSLLLAAMSLPFAFPKFKDERAYASPLRIGLSESGIHVEYDERGASALSNVGWAKSLIRWDEIGSLSPEVVLWGRPTQLETTRKDTGALAWRVVEITPDLVDRIVTAWKLRTDTLR